ncbi:MAG TPA: hypothetical protein VEJ36_06985 [Nitrososphaerales archaeon]|nr:hypothetical protein [Nitrososphaerales archaeon]
MKLRLEHQLPKKIRYAKVYFEAGSTSISFSLDGTNATWQASIGKGREYTEVSDKEYSRMRARNPALETVDDDGRVVVIRNSQGDEERWAKPQWVLMDARSRHEESR